LSSLDLSNNTRLYDLNCSDNQIPTLKVDHLTGLEYLTASKNQFTSMDLSKNSRLQSINLSDNRLTALDIRNGNNADISTGGFAVRDNPDLTCIAVDDLAHANASWTQIDPQMSFSTSCLTSSQERQVGRLLIYPNPTHDQLTVSLPKGMLLRQLVLTDMHGREVVRGTQTSISLANVTAGFYVLKMETDEGQITYGKIRKW
ncbi:MAG: T9SS type A sorting domain-containing protein, partial [Bacteroidota bacterium]